MKAFMHRPINTTRNVRSGLAMTELVVAAGLLITALSLLATLSFRSGKLWQDSQHYKLAADELTNQLERLTLLDEATLDEALGNLDVTPAIKATLSDAKLSGSKIVDEFGPRIVLEINWDRAGKPEPLRLVGWLNKLSEEAP